MNEAVKRTAVIMAGGLGERFWPKSRADRPKQFLSLTRNGKTMIQLAAERMRTVADIKDIYIVTNRSYRGLVERQLPAIPKQNILTEPAGRNTAPCIALAAAVIGAKDPDAVMYVVPSDHIIKNIPLFTDTMENAAAVALAGENIVTIGITPNCPETGYGYIKFLSDSRLKVGGAYRVDRFVEKPDAQTAAAYLRDGRYLWNSGMFVWRLSTIEHNFKKFLPEVYGGLKAIRSAVGGGSLGEAIAAAYQKMPSVSIDYGVMEKAGGIYTIPGNFGWDDVGSWLALARLNETDRNDNYTSGNVVQLDTKGSILVSEGPLTAAVGVKNLVVVAEDDVVLICDKSSTQDIKKLIALLKEKKMEQYL